MPLCSCRALGMLLSETAFVYRNIFVQRSSQSQGIGNLDVMDMSQALSTKIGMFFKLLVSGLLDVQDIEIVSRN